MFWNHLITFYDWNPESRALQISSRGQTVFIKYLNNTSASANSILWTLQASAWIKIHVFSCLLVMKFFSTFFQNENKTLCLKYVLWQWCVSVTMFNVGTVTRMTQVRLAQFSVPGQTSPVLCSNLLHSRTQLLGFINSVIVRNSGRIYVHI